MKSFIPAAAVALAATTAAAYNDFPYAVPSFRFQPFQKLDHTSQTIAEERLGYLDITWNNHGLADVEKKAWKSLTSNERDAAIAIGFTQGTWNCFINHYEDFAWDELAEEGVQEHYRKLGWSQAHWEHTAETVPYTESRWWDMLTDNEKKAANQLCYFEENWDKKDMNPNPSFFPHQVPTFRYMPWSELSSVTRNVASGMLGYDEQLWDSPGYAVVEKNTFLNLDPEERRGAMELGFYTHTWDCFMNHYQSYYWSSFHEDLRIAIETLGWTEAMWSDEATTVPPSEEKVWVDLTSEEKAAATRLCYFQETWDDEPITDWYDYDTGKNTAVTANGPLPKDVELGIFEETGYQGRAPGTVGTMVYTADLNSSFRTVVTSSVLGLVLSVGAFLMM